MPTKEKAVSSIQALRPLSKHLIVYSDGSRIPEKNTAAAAWCENTQHHSIQQLGRASDYGMFEAEFSGLILALHLAKLSSVVTTQRVTVILDNQGVVKDMATKKTT